MAAIVLLTAAVGTGAGAYLYLRPTAEQRSFQGWVEAYLIFVSPDEVGRVVTLSVREGDAVETGAALFALDDDLQRAAVAEAEAAVVNARQAYSRARELLSKAVGSQKAYDDAESVLRTAEARLNSAKTRLQRRRMNSPVTGTVQEVYFREGELVQAGRPIVSLLPPGNVRVRFFVPQAVLPTVHIGDRIAVQCDGCASDLVARVNFISAQAEFTPPVIYSREERARLVFRVEAMPARPADLRVGQPVSVALQGTAGVSHARRR
ncbi:MAG: efflux RND transporter periplasmic adaptor subunit [Hyphomonadaceae bacterium]|jgi:HlyD family secretion protein|nr:efflux RND transporter periplasmic adaptor subunit [Hyphomonadaceae bacterium]